MAKKQSKSAREIKTDKIKSLAEKIGRAKSLTFVNYHGLSAGQISALRAKIKAAGGEFIVEKNTLISRALKISNFNFHLSSDNKSLSNLLGPTAAIIAYEDEIAPIAEIATTSKELGFPTYKFGFLENQMLEAAALESLAKLPGKVQLRAQLVGSLASPIYGFVNVLAANIRNLVSVLDQASKLATS